MLMLRVSMAPRVFTTAASTEDPNNKTGAMPAVHTNRKSRD